MAPDPIHAYLLAGGRGTRLRPLTDHTPKPLLPFVTEPVLWGWLRRLASARLRQVDLLVGADAGPFEHLVETGTQLGLDVAIRTEPIALGSGGALRAAVSARCTDPVLVVNADVVTGASIQRLLAHHRRSSAAATLLATPHDEPEDFGVIDVSGSSVTGFVEKPPDRGRRSLVNGGIYVLEPQVLQWLPAGVPIDLEAEVFPDLVSSARVEASVSVAGWADLGTPQRYLEAHRMALDGRLRWPRPRSVRHVRRGVHVHQEARIDRRVTLVPPVFIGEGAEISRGAVVGPHVVVGRHALIGPRVRLADTVVLDAAHIHAGVAAAGMIIDHGWVESSETPALVLTSRDAGEAEPHVP